MCQKAKPLHLPDANN